jgi:glutamine---fructose-6-phosphate transaminase (isomerizing)
MCGITAYFGNKECKSILINGLKRLEYRGYDSCGISVINNKEIKTVKTKGKVEELDKITKNLKGNIGIAHTRWATHGEPSELNSHPHLDCKNEISIVHNGIIENFESIKTYLEKKGHKFRSETDTEVIVHLIEEFYLGDLKSAVIKALKQIVGTYGVAVIHRNKKELIVARKGSPLIIGVRDEEYFVASDASAIIEHTKEMIYLEDCEIAKIDENGCNITDLEEINIDKEIITVKMNIEEIEKKNYKHFMLKEIFEQPETLKQAILGRIDHKNYTAKLGGIENSLTKEFLEKVNRIIIVACGTSWHCGLVTKFFMERFLKIPVEVDYASEFRYRDPIIDNNSLVIVISQSGETADTLAALREAKKKSAKVIGIINVAGSTISRECDCGIFIRAGPEIGVASTKAFTNQLICLNLLTLYIGRTINKIEKEDAKILIDNIEKIPEIIKKILKTNEDIKEIAKKYYTTKNTLYLGRGISYPIALEGALKLKEISYIHAEGYPAAEMKHGPIALIEKDLPVIVIANNDLNYDKVLSNIHEAKARGAKIVAIGTEKDTEISNLCDDVIFVPDICDNLLPFVNVVPLQLLAYHIADLKGCTIDQPRNLAKSVTVE